MWNEHSSIVATRNQVSCDLGGETAILNLSSGVYFGLDDIGSRIWALMQRPTTLGQIQKVLVDEYDVEPAQASSDLNKLCEELASARLIELT